MRLLVTGASGQLGSEMLALAPATSHELIGVTHAEIDLRESVAVEALVRDQSPDVVVNCAAWTQVDLAEAHREEAFAVNADGAANLARACASHGALLCHMSTDYVFGNADGEPLDEEAEPFPLNVYGASKLAGENAVRRALPHRHLIVRTSWLYGRDGPNFVLTMLRLARERRALRVVSDQTGSPTWTGHLAPSVLRLIELEAQGVVHLTSGGSTTWRDFAQAIVSSAGMRGIDVAPISTTEYAAPARRPAFSVLDNRRWRELGQPPLPHWSDGLRAYLAEVGAGAAAHAATVEAQNTT